MASELKEAADAFDLVEAVKAAVPGEQVTYYRGENLATARMKDREADRLATAAERLHAKGAVLLVQKRSAAGTAYIAVKRKS
jgi:hypothetical protein